MTLLSTGLQWHFTRASTGEQCSPHRLVVRDFYPSAVKTVRERLHSWASKKGTRAYNDMFQTLLLGNAGVGKVCDCVGVVRAHS